MSGVRRRLGVTRVIRLTRLGTGAVQDALFLASMTTLSLASYVRGLGFYLDDYSFLRVLGQSHRQSFFGLYDALSAGAAKTRMRPVQIATLAGLYNLFGSNAHAYHMFNAFVLVGGVLLVYFVLRELDRTRLVSVAAALLYATLPHFSTDRFWVAAFQANVSMTLFFASQYAALRALRAKRGPWWGWVVVALVSAVGSALAYEVALPLFLLTPFLVVWRSRHIAARETYTGMPRRAQALLGFSLLTLVVAIAAKVAVAVRVGHESSYQLGVEGGLFHHLAYLVSGSIKLSVGSYGLGLPYVVGWIFEHKLTWTIAILTFVAGLAAFAYLQRLARPSRSEVPSTTEAKSLLGIGIVVYVLGYAIFLTNSEIYFTSAGVDNRVNIAAASGVALVLIGAVAWIGTVLPRTLQGRGFALGITLLSTAGFLIVNALGSFWVEAARKQGTVLAALRADLPPRPGRSTVLLDGVCPEIGPAIVFTTQYDLTGALFLRLRDPDLNAAVLTPFVQVRERSLSIANFFNGHRTSLRSFPYGQKTLIYNYETRASYRLTDRSSARRYFQTQRSRIRCPPIRSFIWDIPKKWHRFTA